MTKELQPCKIGTIPMLVRVHGSDKIEPGRWVRIQDGTGQKWTKVLIEKIDETGYFFASR